MFSSKWKLIGFVLYLAFRLAVRHPMPFAVVLVREAIECRAGSAAPPAAPGTALDHAPRRRFSNPSR